MADQLALNSPSSFVGLGTKTYVVPTSGPYYVQIDCSENPPSSLSIVINDNGSPVYTNPSLTPAQGATRFKVDLNLTSGHTITIVLSSSAPIDNQLNTIQSIITIGQGA